MFPLDELVIDVRIYVLHLFERLKIQELINEWKKRLINVENITIECCKESNRAIKIDYMWNNNYMWGGCMEMASNFYVQIDKEYKNASVGSELLGGIPKYQKFIFLEYL